MDGGRDGDEDGDEAKVSKIFQAILDPRIVLAAEAPRRSRGAGYPRESPRVVGRGNHCRI